MAVVFTVYGVPVPQAGTKTVPVGKTRDGSRTMFRKITEGGVGLLPWRQAIAEAARVAAVEHGVQHGPLKLDVTFRFPMPKSRPKRMREPGAMVWKLTAPDTDKLLRAVGDSCTEGGLISDDSTFVMVVGRKYEVWDDWTGALVTVQQFDRDTIWLPAGPLLTGVVPS